MAIGEIEDREINGMSADQKPHGHYETIKQYRISLAELRERLDREPTDQEVQSELSFTDEQMEQVRSLTIDEQEEHDFQIRFRISACNQTLRNARESKGMLQKDIACLLGLSTTSYGHIETMRVYPDRDRQQAIAEIVGVPAETLFPQWLELFTQRWRDAEHERIVTLNTCSLEDANFLTEPSNSMVRLAQQSLYVKPVRDAVQTLSPREQKVLDLRFGLTDGISRTLDEVARAFDVNRERIRQIEAKALVRLGIMKGLEQFSPKYKN